MNYLSVCSGIEAATCAWHPLGWNPIAFSEIERFPSSVLAHRYKTVPNLGDMTKYKEWDIEPIELLVGGTPCQSFSVAGLRKGLDDPRGNLMLTYLAIADRFKPRWLVWENVPGVLSSNGGKDFGTFLGGLGELGYGFAYRVLDAQYFGVPQRRRRVFVVGYLGDWRRAAAVLFERHSMQRNNPPSREAGQEIAGTITKCSFDGGAGGRPEGAAGNHFLPVISKCLVAGGQQRYDSETETLIPIFGGDFSYGIDEEGNVTLNGFGTLLRGGQGGTRQSVAYGIQANIIGRKDTNGGNGLGYSTEISPTLTKSAQHTVAFGAQNSSTQGDSVSFDVTPTLDKSKIPGVMTGAKVRRLLPVECERLQGFEDGYTDVPHEGKRAADGNRYKAIGNSMAVPCMRWLGERIQAVENIK